MTDQSIGKLITKLRVNKNLSQVELANRTGLSYSTVRNIESFKSIPSLIVAKTLAKALKISLDELTKKLSIKKGVKA